MFEKKEDEKEGVKTYRSRLDALKASKRNEPIIGMKVANFSHFREIEETRTSRKGVFSHDLAGQPFLINGRLCDASPLDGTIKTITAIMETNVDGMAGYRYVEPPVLIKADRREISNDALFLGVPAHVPRFEEFPAVLACHDATLWSVVTALEGERRLELANASAHAAVAKCTEIADRWDILINDKIKALEAQISTLRQSALDKRTRCEARASAILMALRSFEAGLAQELAQEIKDSQ